MQSQQDLVAEENSSSTSLITVNDTRIFNELKALLKDTYEKDAKTRTEAIKKVISYMLSGVNVSKLLCEMAMLCSKSDLAQKKMIFLYFRTIAETEPEIVILTISTLYKDCYHPEPQTRALALRTLCSLKIPGIFEYIYNAVTKFLKDPDPYVRKTGVLGILKLYNSKPRADHFNMEIIIDLLNPMIRDKDAIVASNAITTLAEILREEGGVAASSEVIHYLLNRMKEFDEWGQCIIFELLSNYQPISFDELIDILDLIDEQLETDSAIIVLACIKAFLHLTKDDSTLHERVYQRIQAHLIMLASTNKDNGSEVAYTIFTHIRELVLKGEKEHLKKEFKVFSCNADDPAYIKRIKIEILTHIVSSDSFQDILDELSEYVVDADSEISRKSIRAITSIVDKLQEKLTFVVKRLAIFLVAKQEHIINECTIVLKDILQKHRGLAKQIINVLLPWFAFVNDVDAEIAVVWILGEFGEIIEDSSCMLEKFVCNIKEEYESNTKLKFSVIHCECILLTETFFPNSC